MTLTFLIIILLLLSALQVRLPALPGLGVHLEFIPALVAYSALTLSRPGIFAFALAAGLTQDALSAGPFGVSALVYVILALLLHRFRGALDRDLPVLQIGAGLLVALVAGIVGSGVAGFPAGTTLKLFYLSLLSAFITPVLFFALDYLRYQWRPA